MIGYKTTIHQSSNEVDESKFGYNYDKKKWKNETIHLRN